MKRTCLAIAIATVAVSAQAHQIYNKNGTVLTIGGEVKVIAEKHNRNDGWKKLDQTIAGKEVVTDKDFEKVWLIPSAELNIGAMKMLSNDVIAKAGFTLSGSQGRDVVKGKLENDDSYKVENIFVSLEGKAGEFSFGDTGTALDALSNTNFTNESEFVYDHFDGALEGRGVRYHKAIDNIHVSVDYQQFGDFANGEDQVSGSLGYKTKHVGVTAFYSKVVDGTVKGNITGGAINYQVHGLELAANYANYDDVRLPKIGFYNFDGYGAPAYLKGQTYSLGVSQTVDNFRMYGGFERVDADKMATYESKDVKFESDTFFAGTEYNFDETLKVFAEAAFKEGKLQNSTNKRQEFVVGTAYTF